MSSHFEDKHHRMFCLVNSALSVVETYLKRRSKSHYRAYRRTERLNGNIFKFQLFTASQINYNKAA